MTSVLRQSRVVLALLIISSRDALSISQNQPLFDLLEIRVDGNSVLEQRAVEKIIYPYLGPQKSIDAVEQARQALEKLYRDNGYSTVLVEIPEQDVVDGLVRLKVVEGTVENLKVSGSRYYSLGKITDKIPALAAGSVPHMPSVQQQMADLSKESTDRQIIPIFRAGSTPGKTEVELKVKDELPLHGGVEINGNNSQSTTRTRLISSLRYDNLWQKFHSASLQFQTSPENNQEVEVWSGTYVLPTGWEDTRLALYGIGISSNTQLGASVGGMSVVGTGSIYGARLIKPLATLESYQHSFLLGFDHKSFDQAMGLQGQDKQSSPISYPVFQLGYDGSWRGDSHQTSLSSALHFAVRGMGTDAAQFYDRRFKAKPDFAYISSELKHLQEIFLDMRLSARLSGQVANGPLISNEQFSAGGMQSVRGYHQTQQLGDDGVNLSFEWQSPQLVKTEWDFAQGLRAHAFVDYAYLRIRDALPTNPDYYTLAGTGLGLRWQLIKHFVGQLDWAYPLYRQGVVGVGDQRVDFRLAYEF